MSALWAPQPSEDREAQVRPRSLLRPVSLPAERMARVPFVLVLIALFGVGMAGLLMLNTTLQNQAFQAQDLNRQATTLTYDEATLQRAVDDVQAPQELARRASQLGMRPNPYPAFVNEADGKIIGYPKQVKGNEDPSQIVKTPAQIAAEERAAEARKVAAEAAAKAKAAAEAKAKAEAAAKKKAEDEAAAKAEAQKKAESQTKTKTTKAESTKKTETAKKNGRN